MYCLCVNVYCTTATGCQPNCSWQLYQYQYQCDYFHPSLITSTPVNKYSLNTIHAPSHWLSNNDHPQQSYVKFQAIPTQWIYYVCLMHMFFNISLKQKHIQSLWSLCNSPEYPIQLIPFRTSTEQWTQPEELCHYTATWPNVYGCGVGQSKEDFRWAVPQCDNNWRQPHFKVVCFSKAKVCQLDASCICH